MAVIQDQEKILRKLRALIARAEHANTPAPEAKLCREQAEKLMAKYSINAALIGDLEGNKTKPSDFKFDIFGSYQNDRAILINGIAHIFNCQVIVHRNRWSKEVDFSIYGFEADLDMVWTLFNSVDLQLVEQLNGMSGTVGFKKSFISGFTSEVTSRLKKFYAEEVAASTNDAPGTELVLASRKDAVEEYRNDKIGKVSKGRKRDLNDYSGYGSGIDAGSKADIGLNSNKLKNQGALAV